MVVYYQIAGKQVGSHVLAMGVMGTLFGGIFLSTRGGGQKKQATPPIQASSKDEEKFIHLQLHIDSAHYHWALAQAAFNQG
ncbi:hypothetical protein CNMCM5793_000451 [Aspergillus hiratsukae]|uniref:Uncharacterized protein n=1 Tax=Aspergillus hiratsukae TaxID=1194566 RepID=A0A8H6PXG2_9EURO|nr:hypothetical protein CNMCM5793_000451 [Aspergillus hiratsukae]KAF7161977.1 hypothetical protein CNMCM6106_009058 [Aspergillus hiratsukae]